MNWKADNTLNAFVYQTFGSVESTNATLGDTVTEYRVAGVGRCAFTTLFKLLATSSFTFTSAIGVHRLPFPRVWVIDQVTLGRGTCAVPQCLVLTHIIFVATSL